MKTCFFIGHRDAPNRIKLLLYEAIERHITEYGVTHFVVGHFDLMAAQAVCEAKSGMMYHFTCISPTTPQNVL